MKKEGERVISSRHRRAKPRRKTKSRRGRGKTLGFHTIATKNPFRKLLLRGRGGGGGKRKKGGDKCHWLCHREKSDTCLPSSLARRGLEEKM